MRQTDAIRARFNCLTARERELAKLLLDGLSNKAIGAELALSQRTVELHRANLMEKMGAASLAHLVRMLMDLERSAGS
jgi:two-component system, LuxR family, response regulator FixJ